MYVSSRPAVDLLVNGQPANLKALQQIKADSLARGSINVEYGGKRVISFTAEESGNFLIVIFDKADGGIAGMTLPDYG